MLLAHSFLFLKKEGRKSWNHALRVTNVMSLCFCHLLVSFWDQPLRLTNRCMRTCRIWPLWAASYDVTLLGLSCDKKQSHNCEDNLFPCVFLAYKIYNLPFCSVASRKANNRISTIMNRVNYLNFCWMSSSKMKNSMGHCMGNLFLFHITPHFLALSFQYLIYSFINVSFWHLLQEKDQPVKVL